MREFIFYTFLDEFYFRVHEIINLSLIETLRFGEYVKTYIFSLKQEFKNTDTTRFSNISSHIVSSSAKQLMDEGFVEYLKNKGYDVSLDDLENLEIEITDKNLTIYLVKSLYRHFKAKYQIHPMIYIITFWNFYWMDIYQYIQVKNAPRF